MMHICMLRSTQEETQIDRNGYYITSHSFSAIINYTTLYVWIVLIVASVECVFIDISYYCDGADVWDQGPLYQL